ncbi:hypothetical protein PanWU01x14_346350 [Parasponia andersonii]|uniref:Uncharacterized protein n=1 Tax=Parasponia andersonii TaxID=3476 RepID=A0A2P5ACE6_PARAD|nr:hypothetical protein PanWU01x14_346350 [Parasponia andersonii]
MEIGPITYYESLKRYWRRRRYQRLHGSNHTKRKVLITRLGDGGSRRRQWKMRSYKPKLLVSLRRILSPLTLLAKFHDAYVDTMIWLAGNMATGAGAFAGKKVAKTKQISTVSSNADHQELVDSRLVLEIYKRLAASRQMAAY